MGLSVSASAAILFVAFVICFGSLFGAVNRYYTTVDDIAQENQDHLMDIQGTAIEFLSIDGNNDTFTVLNIGTETLQSTDFELLIDGVMVQAQDYQVSILGHPNSTLMFPGDKAVFQVNGDIDDGRIMVITNWGRSIIHVPS